MATSTADPLHQHPFRQDVVFRVDEQALSSGPDCLPGLPAVSTIGHADFVGHGQLERPSKWQYFNATKTARDTPAIRSRDATSRVPQVSRKVERAQPVPATPATEDSTRLGHATRGQTPAQTTREWRNTESEKKALCPLTCLTTLSPIPRTATCQHAKNRLLRLLFLHSVLESKISKVPLYLLMSFFPVLHVDPFNKAHLTVSDSFCIPVLSSQAF